MAKGKWLTISWLLVAVLTVTFVATRNAAADQPNLRQIRTEHYLIQTDLDPELADELAKRMEGMFGEYSRRLAEFQEKGAIRRLDVYLFAHKADYAKLTEDRFRNTGGIFIAGRKNLLAAFLEDQGRDTLRRTLQHEAFHQFAYNTISPDLPIWLNEGMAQVFEEGIWVGDNFVLGQVSPRRLRQLKSDIDSDKLMDFQKFMAVTPDEWSKNLFADASRGATQYGQAWAMVHYLVNGENGALRRRLIDMLKMMHDGKAADTAFVTAFSANYEGFRRHFNDWSATVAATPEAVMIERQNVLADLVVSLNERGKQFDDITAFRRAVTAGGYQLQYTKGDVKWKTDARLDNYFSNADGQLLSPRQLYFGPKTSVATPADIVCECSETVQLRTHFYQLGGKWWHESKIETK